MVDRWESYSPPNDPPCGVGRACSSEERPPADLRTARTVSGQEVGADRAVGGLHVVGVVGRGIDVAERLLDRSAPVNGARPGHVEDEADRLAGRPDGEDVRLAQPDP